MIGEVERASRPHLVITTSSQKFRLSVVDTVHRSGILDRYEGVRLASAFNPQPFRSWIGDRSVDFYTQFHREYYPSVTSLSSGHEVAESSRPPTTTRISTAKRSSFDKAGNNAMSTISNQIKQRLGQTLVYRAEFSSDWDPVALFASKSTPNPPARQSRVPSH
jgi:hypothetical protein